jgi:hypothetical protein
MKTIITALAALCLLIVAGCNETQNIAVTAMSSSQRDLDARLGYLHGENTEVGVSAKYEVADSVEWDELTPDGLGPYVMFYPTIEAEITDLPALGPLGPILESFNAQPYGGIEIVGNIGNGEARNFQPNYILGTRFSIDQSPNVFLNVEFVTGDAIDTDQVKLGGTVRF